MHAVKSPRWYCSLALVAPLVLSTAPLVAQTATPRAARIVSAIDDTRLVTLRGNTHPATTYGQDLGPVSPAMPLNRMLLVLQRGPALQAALDAFMAGQYDPKSPDYHHWLSPQQYGELYGPADADIAQITAWLRAQGFAVAKVANSRMTIEFSATAAQAEKTFHVQIHNYLVNGESHFANSADPQIPEALAPVVLGVHGLSDFEPKSRKTPNVPLVRNPATGRIGVAQPASSVISPRYTQSAGGSYYLAPGDFDVIYNTTPLLNAGVDGSGVTIAVVARSNILQSDVSAYRAMFGLPDNPFTVVLDGPDPGLVTGDQGENTLDVEMVSMAAPGAKIQLVVSPHVTLSSLYIVDNQLASVMTTSYGQCELNSGTTGNALNNSIWQQASAEGISSFVSAGDSGAADCENDNLMFHVATTGLQADGLSGTPWNTSVGATDFNDQASPTTYWSNNNSATGASALSYIPESPWNASCANPFVWQVNGGTDAQSYCNAQYALGVNNGATGIQVQGGGGGVSNCTTPTGTTPSSCSGGYAKPTWQAGPGVPADGKRDTPDVSLMGASGATINFVANYENGALSGTGGTSASSPMMAGLMALVVQKQGMAQGLANPVFYKLAAAQNTANCNSSTVTAGNACFFNDVTTGNIVEPCALNSTNCVNGTAQGDQIGILSGNNTTVGYDTASGLGSVNAANLVNGWSTQAPPTAVTVSLAPTTLPALSQNTQYYQQITAGGGTPQYAYLVSSGTLPAGVTLTPGGILSGTPTTQAAYNFTIIACDSATANGPNCGTQAYNVTVGVPTIVVGSTINWVPTGSVTYNGLPIGAGVLNATAVGAGTISYTYLVSTGASSGATGTATATTVLAPGQYLITATNSTDNSTVTINFTVLPQHEWVVNAAGNLTALNAAGTTDPTPIENVTGGGLGIAIDSQGTAWSANTNGTSVSTFSNYGYNFQTGPTGGGLSAAAAVAIDGAGSLWVANGNGSVSQFTHEGVALSPTGGYTGGGLSGSTGIAIDESGSVWVSNGGNNTTTEILGAATPVAPLAQAVTDNTVGVKP